MSLFLKARLWREAEWSLDFVLGIGRSAKVFKEDDDMIKDCVSQNNFVVWRAVGERGGGKQKPAREERAGSIHSFERQVWIEYL